MKQENQNQPVRREYLFEKGSRAHKRYVEWLRKQWAYDSKVFMLPKTRKRLDDELEHLSLLAARAISAEILQRNHEVYERKHYRKYVNIEHYYRNGRGVANGLEDNIVVVASVEETLK